MGDAIPLTQTLLGCEPSCGRCSACHQRCQGAHGGQRGRRHFRVRLIPHAWDVENNDCLLCSKDYFTGFEKEGIDATSVRALAGQKTGVANIIVDDGTGENRILFTANANYVYSEQHDRLWDMVPREADVVVFQLEIPLRVVC